MTSINERDIYIKCRLIYSNYLVKGFNLFEWGYLWCFWGTYIFRLHCAIFLTVVALISNDTILVSLGSFNKTRRQRRGERHQTKGLMTKTIAVHVRSEPLRISLPFSAQQQREMTKFCIFWRTQTAMANLLYLNAVGAYLAWTSF